MMQARVFISGFVQGVGYRQFVKRNAQELGLFGWVNNLSDGRVEAVFQGEKAKIDQTIKLCQKGPFLSVVEDAQVIWEDGKEEYKDFVVVFS